MDVTEKKDEAKHFIRPSDEEIKKGRLERKEIRKKRVEAKKQKIQDEIIENTLASTSKSYADYLSDRYITRPGVPPAGRLHPGTLAFLEKFRPSIFKTLNLEDKQVSSKKEAGTSPSETPPSVSIQAEEEKDS